MKCRSAASLEWTEEYCTAVLCLSNNLIRAVVQGNDDQIVTHKTANLKPDDAIVVPHRIVLASAHFWRAITFIHNFEVII